MGCVGSKTKGSDAYTHGEDPGPGPGHPKPSPVSLQKRQSALLAAELMLAKTVGKRFHDIYVRPTLLSYGASCKVLTAYNKATQQKVAVKTIPKDKRSPAKQRLAVLSEVGIMQEVEEHPNAVKLLEVYESQDSYYVVMECCDGGELFEHLAKAKEGFTEREAAQHLRSLMLFLAHMHGKGIAHMDIKPENIMFDSEGANGVLKVIDFGSSVFVQPDEQVRDAFGTVRYSSPEMANDEYIGQGTDIWSAGVLMYLMLCGRPPFLKNNDVDTLNFIKKKPKVKFSGKRWANISKAAKDCIQAMLSPEPAQRPTAQEVLQMSWLKNQVPDTAIPKDTLQHLRAFGNQSLMRRMLLGVMAMNLTGREAQKLLHQFYLMDTDCSGKIDLKEMVKAVKMSLPEISEEEISRIFKSLDLDSTGTVDVKEFFAGLLQTMDMEQQLDVAKKSFHNIDTNRSGYLTKEAFVQSLIQLVPPETADVDQLTRALEQEFDLLDTNGDGQLSFEEFKAVLELSTLHNSSHRAGTGSLLEAGAEAGSPPVACTPPRTIELPGQLASNSQDIRGLGLDVASQLGLQHAQVSGLSVSLHTQAQGQMQAAGEVVARQGLPPNLGHASLHPGRSTSQLVMPAGAASVHDGLRAAGPAVSESAPHTPLPHISRPASARILAAAAAAAACAAAPEHPAGPLTDILREALYRAERSMSGSLNTVQLGRASSPRLTAAMYGSAEGPVGCGKVVPRAASNILESESRVLSGRRSTSTVPALPNIHHHRCASGNSAGGSTAAYYSHANSAQLTQRQGQVVSVSPRGQHRLHTSMDPVNEGPGSGLPSAVATSSVRSRPPSATAVLRRNQSEKGFSVPSVLPRLVDDGGDVAASQRSGGASPRFGTPTPPATSSSFGAAVGAASIEVGMDRTGPGSNGGSVSRADSAAGCRASRLGSRAPSPRDAPDAGSRSPSGKSGPLDQEVFRRVKSSGARDMAIWADRALCKVEGRAQASRGPGVAAAAAGGVAEEGCTPASVLSDVLAASDVLLPE